MKLHTIQALLGVSDRGEGRAACARERAKALRNIDDLVSVRHPDVGLFAAAKAQKETLAPLDAHARRAVLPRFRALDAAAEQVRHELHSVANSRTGRPIAKIRGSTIRQDSSNTLDGPPDRMIATGFFFTDSS